MDVEYFYCSSCGYEDYDITVAYSRTVANGDLCICPKCKKESSNFEQGQYNADNKLLPEGDSNINTGEIDMKRISKTASVLAICLILLLDEAATAETK